MNLIDQFKQTWSTYVDNSPKALNYRLCKKGVSFENYLDILAVQQRSVRWSKKAISCD